MRWHREVGGTLDKFKLYDEELQKGAKRGVSTLAKKRTVKNSQEGRTVTAKRRIKKSLAKLGQIKKRIRLGKITDGNRSRK